ncbi:MAG: type II toxin-antitoxin system MqsA family antitoxin [Gammaproteobacteria bacterium]|nr:type II toxin-antitoxin system MqsA family antitoxin [Gammaproteobacteria bacterium]
MEEFNLEPGEIRRIRKQLGLTQSEAGKIIGGGPSAFAKYESGDVKPSTAIVRLLQVARSYPEAVGLPLKKPATRPAAVAPFEVTTEHIEVLSEFELPVLISRLLNAEAKEFALPLDGIRVSTEIKSPDGGEDARIKWDGGPERTDFVPSRFVQFQLKSGSIKPSRATQEVIASSGDVKEMISSALNAGAHYVLICTRRYNQKEIEEREQRIHDALTVGGKQPEHGRIRFWDAGLLAQWVNHYPAVAIWLMELTQPGTVAPFRSWKFWSEQSSYTNLFIDDSRLALLRDRVMDELAEARRTLRVLGAASVGKSRLVLEAFRLREGFNDWLSDFVLFVDWQLVDPNQVFSSVDSLVGAGKRAILVVDNCPDDIHRSLSEKVLNFRSNLSLLTIDCSQESAAEQHRSDVHIVELAPPEITEGIIEQMLGGIATEDKLRLTLFSKGFPRIAIDVANAWSSSVPVAHASEKFFVDTFVCGRTVQARLIQSAQLVAAYGLIRDGEHVTAVEEVAERGGITAIDFRADLVELIDRRVVQKRGDLLVLQPRPVAFNLAERQWRTWSPTDRRIVLAGDGMDELRSNAARQLAWLNTSKVAREVVEQLCGPTGPLASSNAPLDSSRTELLGRLVEIDAKPCLDQIRRLFEQILDLCKIRGDMRRHIVVALQKAAFCRGTFHEAADLLLRLAAAETETHISNNATGQFKSLFYPSGGETEANGSNRLAFLQKAKLNCDRPTRSIIVEGLLAGLRTLQTTRLLGSESHGSRPALQSWQPHSREELLQYMRGCMKQLEELEKIEEEMGTLIRDGLARNLRGLVRIGLINEVEALTKNLSVPSGPWSEAIEQLGHFLEYDSSQVDALTSARVESLIKHLEPTELADRARYLVLDMPRGYPCGKNLEFEVKAKLQREAIEELGKRLSQASSILAELLPQFSVHQNRHSFHFGFFLAQSVDSPQIWLKNIVCNIVSSPSSDPCFDLLVGFVSGLAKVDEESVTKFKRRIAQDSVLSSALPRICQAIGVYDDDVDLVVSALDLGTLEPRHLLNWSYGDCLSEVSSPKVAMLLDKLLDGSSASFFVAVDILSMHSHSASHRLQSLRPQLMKIAELTCRDGDELFEYAHTTHDVSRLMGWLLRRGREDEDARKLALLLGQTVIAQFSRRLEQLIGPLLRALLSDFAEIFWPFLGHAAMKEDGEAWRIRELLKGPMTFEQDIKEPPMMGLFKETLTGWCKLNPDGGPAVVANVVPFLSPEAEGSNKYELNPQFRRLLDDFGDCDEVLQAASSSIFTNFSWAGSLARYFDRFIPAIQSLQSHPQPKVARWAWNSLYFLREEIERARKEEDEHQAMLEV